MPTLTWADAHFCAAHRSRDGKLHGHTWRVRAYWNADGADANVWQAMLREALREVDHAELSDSFAWGEQIAHWIGTRLNCQRVDVWREPEGLGATWAP